MKHYGYMLLMYVMSEGGSGGGGHVINEGGGSPAGEALLTRYSVSVLAKKGLCLAMSGCKALAISCFNTSGWRVLTWSMRVLPIPPPLPLVDSDVGGGEVVVGVEEWGIEGLAGVDVTTVVGKAIVVDVVVVVVASITAPIAPVPPRTLTFPPTTFSPFAKVAMISFKEGPSDEDMV